jgi:hypothetical protein
MLSNLAFEPTRNGWSLQASISFWAFLAQLPLAVQLRRWASSQQVPTANGGVQFDDRLRDS